MENNIFEGAKFGDKFLTSDNTIAIYLWYEPEDFSEDDICKGYVLATEKDGINTYNDYGFWTGGTNYIPCIVSRYQESFDKNMHKLCDSLSSISEEEASKKLHEEIIKLILEEYGNKDLL